MPTYLIGRDREVEAVFDVLDRVSEHGEALVVRGEAGIGKSALLAATAERARERGMLVLTTSGVQSETHLPFAGLHQLLRPIWAGIDALPAPQRAAVLAAFGMTNEGAPDVFLIALAVLDLLAEAAVRTPLLLVVEDAHWVDRATHTVLAFVARRLASEPIVMLFAARDDLASPLDQLDLPELRLEGLDEGAAGALLDARTLGLTTAVRARLLEEAAGNPLALAELPAALDIEQRGGTVPLPAWLPLTTRLERTFTARMTDLPVDTRTLLLVAAVDEGGDITEILAAAGPLLGDAEIAADALQPAIDASLITVVDLDVRFRHPLVRSAIYQAASAAQRHAAHAALAAVLTDQPDRSAWHRAAASVGPNEAVAAELEEAAIRSRRRGAVAIAGVAFERAARFSTDPAGRARRLLRAAEQAFELGRHDDLARIVRGAESLDLGDIDRARFANLMIMSDGIGGIGAHDASAYTALVDLAAQTIAEGDMRLALLLLLGASIRCRLIDPGADIREAIIACTERALVADDDPVLLNILALVDPIGRAAMVIERLDSIQPDSRMGARIAYLHFGTAMEVGAYHIAARFAAIAIERMRAQGRLGPLAQILVQSARMSASTSSLHQANAEVEEGIALAQETDQPFWVAHGYTVGALVAGLGGNADHAEAQAAAAAHSVPLTERSLRLTELNHARAVTALGAGRYEDAFAHLLRIYDPADPAFNDFFGFMVIDLLAEAAVHTGHRADARRKTLELTQRAEGNPSPRVQNPLRFARAVLADDSAAESLFHEALQSDLEGYPLDRARLQLAFGTWLRRHRRLVESRSHLRAARETFDALDALPWGERARQELRAAGETSRRRAPNVHDVLTPQELQIAQMAAEGLTNREIGQRLYLSHRTIGAHLYHVFPKLGITHRSELHTALDATPPTVPGG
jgi:DNA-binding NarL/FixJ family response regulator